MYLEMINFSKTGVGYIDPFYAYYLGWHQGRVQRGVMWAITPALGDCFNLFFFLKKNMIGVPQNKVDEIPGVFFSKSGLNFLGEVGPPLMAGAQIAPPPQ